MYPNIFCRLKINFIDIQVFYIFQKEVAIMMQFICLCVSCSREYLSYHLWTF